MASSILFPTLAMGMATLVMAVAGEGETNMVFYRHANLIRNNDETAFPVAGLNGSSSDPGKFGTLVVFSDVISKRPQITESDSDDIVGLVQGMYVNTNPVTRLDFFTVFTVVFHNKEYSGSTLEMHGTDRFYQPYSEYAVVGGTGRFRFASGYGLGTTESSYRENVVMKFNTTFRTN